MVQRAINAEAKTGLKSMIMVQDLDIRCLQGHYPSNSIALKMQTKEIIVKDSHLEELEVKEIKLTLFSSTEASELSK